MGESPQTPPSRKKKLVIAGLGAAAVIVLTAGTIVGVNVSSGNKTEQLCTEGDGYRPAGCQDRQDLHGGLHQGPH